MEICPSSFVLRKPFLSIAISKKVTFDWAMCLFSTFLRLQGDHHCACAQSGVIFIFSKSCQTKKIKTLQPKMTKIASKGSCLKDGPVTYPADAFDSCLWGDKIPLGSSLTKSLNVSDNWPFFSYFRNFLAEEGPVVRYVYQERRLRVATGQRQFVKLFVLLSSKTGGDVLGN